MNTSMLPSIHINLTNKRGFIYLYVLYGLILSVVLTRAGAMNELNIGDSNSLKIWILAAVMSGMMALLTFFLKRLLDSIDKTSTDIKLELREIGTQLKTHDSHISSIITTLAYHKEKIEWLRNRVTEREKP